MKKNKVIALFLIVFVMCTFTICTYYFKCKNLDKEIPEIKLKNKIVKNNTMAIMISNDGNNYEEYKKETWPGYSYKFKEAKCINNNGEFVDDAVTFADGKVTLITNQTLYCTLYFDYKGTIEILKENDFNNNLSSDLPGGMHRYQGTDNVANWICFGTKDKEQCTDENTGIDKYMYRIIGITEDGKMKLIKETFLQEESLTNFAWNDKYYASGSEIYVCNEINCPEWGSNILFKRLNGKSNGSDVGSGSYKNNANTDIFVDSSTYDYLKSGDEVNGTSSASEWYTMIFENKWLYGDLGENTVANEFNGDSIYAIESGNADTKHWTQKNESIVQEPYSWTKTAQGKIGLMYLHDYYYSYYDKQDKNSRGNAGSYDKLINSWLHFQKDGYNASPLYEWLIPRWGVASKSSKIVNAWVVYNTGNKGNGGLNGNGGVRPVFYLESSVKLTSGDGTKDNPYIINAEEI